MRGRILYLPMILLSSVGAAQAQQIAALPDSQSMLPFISGGIGESEVRELESVQNDYNLKLTLAAENGMYLADVPVRITDKQGNVMVDTVSEGPILLTQLPPGTYKVTARAQGIEKPQNITVGKTLKSVTLHFPATEPLP